MNANKQQPKIKMHYSFMFLFYIEKDRKKGLRRSIIKEVI